MRILVVEDDQAVRLVLTRFLDGLGHQVTAVVSAEEALQRLDQSQFEVLITDYRLPSMTGLDLIRNLRDPVEIKIVLMSGNPTEISSAELADAGIDLFLQKPFKLDAISLLLGA